MLCITLITGGTVDITVHEVIGETGLKEIASASGGNWGGTKVDATFEEFMKGLVGEEVYRKFSVTHRDDFLELLRTFEIKKRSVTADTESDVIFSLPLSLTEIHQDITGRSLNESISREDISLTTNKLRCKSSTFKELFQETCDNIVKHVAKLLDGDNTRGVTVLMMVGGFSECAILQDAMKRSFPHLKLFVPRDASLCVLKGAVMYGHNPEIISQRVVRYTYGTSVFKMFEEGFDPMSKKVLKERGFVCKDVFSTHVQKNQVVKAGEPQKQKRYRPLKTDQSVMSLPIFASEYRNPRYVTDPGCTQIGFITVDMPKTSGGLTRDVLVRFTFSGTEIHITAEDTSSGNVSNVNVDLLS